MSLTWEPSKREVELAIEQLEITDEREKRKIRDFWNERREDELRPIALKWRLTILFCAGLFGGFVLWYLGIAAFDALVAIWQWVTR